jgi:hypothetical protein
MHLEEAVGALKKKGFAAEVVTYPTQPFPYILGGVRKVGVLTYDDAFTVTRIADVWVARTAHGDIGDEQECCSLDEAVDWLYHVYLDRKAIKPVPTSKSWAEDARALLDMGATSIDANTVRGLLSDLEKHRGVLKCIQGKLLGRIGMNSRTSALHEDLGVRHDAGVRARAYVNALDDVQSVFSDLENGE